MSSDEGSCASASHKRLFVVILVILVLHFLVFTQGIAQVSEVDGDLLLGYWRSNLADYVFLYSGSALILRNSTAGEDYQCTIVGTTLAALWEGDSYSAAIEIDPNGIPERIVFENGPVLTRVSVGWVSSDETNLSEIPQLDLAMVSALAAAGVDSSEDLIEIAKSLESIASLSETAGLSITDLLGLAYEVEMRIALGPSFTNSALSLLETLDLDSLSSLAEAEGREEAFYAYVSSQAAAIGIESPSWEDMSNWIAIALETELPSMAELVEPLTRQIVSAVNASSGMEVTKAYTEDLLGVRSFLSTSGAAAMDLADVIQAGQKPEKVEYAFSAPRAGLYVARVEVNDGPGHVHSWRIFARDIASLGGLGSQSSASASATYTETTLAKGDVSSRSNSTLWIYFSVEQPTEGTTRGLFVELSAEYDSGATGSDIEFTHVPSYTQTRIRIGVAPMSPVFVDCFDAYIALPTDQVSDGPMTLLQMPPLLDSVVREAPADVFLEFWTPTYSKDRIAQEMGGQAVFEFKKTVFQRFTSGSPDVEPLALFRDGSVSDVDYAVSSQGVNYYALENPAAGTYLALVPNYSDFPPDNGCPSASELVEKGWAIWESDLTPAYHGNEFLVLLTGGNQVDLYTAELTSIRVPAQHENGDDKYDGGLGEFAIFVTSGSALPGGDTDVLRCGVPHDNWSTGASLSPPGNPSAGTTRIPFGELSLGMPLVHMTQSDIQAGTPLLCLISVVEEDSTTWWQENKQALEYLYDLGKSLYDMVKSCGADLSAAKSFANVIYEAATAEYKIEEVDDFLGLSRLLVFPSHNYGLTNGAEGEYTFVTYGAKTTSLLQTGIVQDYSITPPEDRGLVMIPKPAFAQAQDIPISSDVWTGWESSETSANTGSDHWHEAKIRIRRTSSVFGAASLALKGWWPLDPMFDLVIAYNLLDKFTIKVLKPRGEWDPGFRLSDIGYFLECRTGLEGAAEDAWVAPFSYFLYFEDVIRWEGLGWVELPDGRGLIRVSRTGLQNVPWSTSEDFPKTLANDSAFKIELRLTPEGSFVKRADFEGFAVLDVPADSDTHSLKTLDDEDLHVSAVTGGEVGTQDMKGFTSATGSSWIEDDQLWWTGANPGDELELSFSVDRTSTYEVRCQLTKAPDYAIVQVSLDGVPVGNPIDCYGGLVEPTGMLPFGTRSLSAGVHKIRLEILGKNPSAVANYFVGIDALQLKEVGPD